MNILQVIHGYPPYYMAGSEVYTFNLCRELATSHKVSVFTRIENPYDPDYTKSIAGENGVTVFRINKPSRNYTFKDKYLDHKIDDAFRDVMDTIQPDIVHVGHLSHLSTQIPIIARREFGVPVVFTIHDFWMQCFRGQLLTPKNEICSGPTLTKCLSCARHFFKDWIESEDIKAYMMHMERVLHNIDLFLSPSRTLQTFYSENGVPSEKTIFSPYGFDKNRIKPVQREIGASAVKFGFLGRIIPVKGIDLLIKAFRRVKGNCRLDIWGECGSHRYWLSNIAERDERIRFRGSYHNDTIQNVFDDMDVLVVPSIWLENSPLVIQEAQLAHIPVITSDKGGMAELVEDGRNGYLFQLGNEQQLLELLQRIVDTPEMLSTLDTSSSGVRCIADDAVNCLNVYRQLIKIKKESCRHLSHRPAPRRITFVTNPDKCNLRCIMCDTHSDYAARSIDNPAPCSELPLGIICSTIAEMAPRGLREIIPSTMGEPLLYGNFEQMLGIAKQYGIKVNLTTNGTFPCGGVDKWAELLLPVLSDVKFSLNGITPAVNEGIMVGVDHHQIISNVVRFIALRNKFSEQGPRCTITLQPTFMERNLDDLPKMLLWAKSAGIDRFKGHHLWVTHPELESESLHRNSESIARWNRMVDTLHAIGNCEIKIDNVNHIRPDNPETGIDNNCPFLGQEAWIEADGTFQICCCPAQIRKDFGVFGSLHDSSLISLWESHSYRSMVENWGDHNNCKICTMKQTRKMV